MDTAFTLNPEKKTRKKIPIEMKTKSNAAAAHCAIAECFPGNTI